MNYVGAMKERDYLFLFMVIAAGSFVALAVWSEIVKQQMSAQIAANPTATTLTSLIGKL